MKLHQENDGFRPISIVLETRDEAYVFLDMLNRVKMATEKDAGYEMAKTISSWLMNEAKL